MEEGLEVKSSRERIVDAAYAVMREQGLARTTTKAIAAAAGYSEAMLYRHFADKQDLFLAVLKERAPRVRADLATAGSGDLAESLTRIVEQLLAFFVDMFPMAASIFSAPELLAQHRDGVRSRGFGPEGPVRMLRAHLDAERALGRVAADADTETAARLLVGYSFHLAFLAAFDGGDAVPDAGARAASAVAMVLPALTPR